MAKSTGPILAVGAITFANKSILHDNPVDIRIVIATGFTALAFSMLEKLNEKLTVGVAWVAFLTVMFARVDPKTPAPVETLLQYWNQK